MNRNDFLNMIGSRSRVNRSMLGEVYELVDLFPYFQSAHMLLLKGLRDNDDVKFEKQLKSSSLHIADREVLYYLLKNDSSEIHVEVNTETRPEGESKPETQQTVIETAKNSELLISEIETDNDKPKAELGNENEETSHGHSVLMPDSNNGEDSEGVVLLIDENGQPEEDKIFYMDPGFSISENSDLLELDTEIHDYEQGADKTEIEEGIIKGEKKGFKKQLQADLIDKFIIANPRIEPVRDRTAQPVEDLAKPHTEVKEGFITETLARIYISQGYYSRAIEIYEKLSLKFPEKSSYFAAQIEKVEEYIKK
jgi:hypothetical protein